MPPKPPRTHIDLRASGAYQRLLNEHKRTGIGAKELSKLSFPIEKLTYIRIKNILNSSELEFDKKGLPIFVLENIKKTTL